MTNIIDETAGWPDVPLIATRDLVLGGPGGPSNKQAIALAARTELLRENQKRTPLHFGSGAAPTQGTWKRGDIVWNQFPTTNGTVGWVCVTAGTPGTWVPFGGIGAASSGYWDPTVTIVSNLDAATAQATQYSQVGQMVTVFGTVLLDPTATGSVSIRLTTPVSSNFTGAFQCGGTMASVDGTIVGIVTADNITKQLVLTANATVTSARNVTFHATYRVI